MRLSQEEELRYWLAEEDYYPSQFTRTYLATTPPGEANDLLERIAKDASLEFPNCWAFLSAEILFALLFHSPFDTSRGRDIARRKAGIRAAFYLAQRGDERALVPLARVWNPGRGGSRPYQEQIERSLIQLLSDTPSNSEELLSTLILVDLLQRAWQAKPLRRDLTSGQSDLILGVLRHLRTRKSRIQDTFSTLLEPASGKNRTLVQQVVREILVGII